MLCVVVCEVFAVCVCVCMCLRLGHYLCALFLCQEQAFISFNHFMTFNYNPVSSEKSNRERVQLYRFSARSTEIIPAPS